MKIIQSALIALFLIVSIAFCVLFLYEQEVVDTEPPVIICDGVPLEVSVNATDRELCAGLSAVDNVDGDITDRIIVRRVSRLIESDRATIYYAVFDSSSNCCTYSRYITYTDYRKPIFSLSQPLIYSVNAQVTLNDRLTATDLIDGNITNRIRVSADNVSTSAAGEYPITVQVTNSSGDTTLIPLTVTIRNDTSQHPVIYLDEYIVFIDSSDHIDLETLREHILSVRESAYGDTVDPKAVEISGEIDYSTFGSNDITFSYTNADGLTYSVILTVVRQ